MEVTVTSVPVLSQTGDRMNPDAMEFTFRKADGSAAAARITGNFGRSLPLTESEGDTAHLEYELEGYWDDQDPGLYQIHWDEPPDELRAVGTTPERLAAGIAEKARSAAQLAHDSALDTGDPDPARARHLLRLMAHHLQDIGLDAEAMF